MDNLRTYDEAKSDIIRFFASLDNSVDTGAAKCYLSTLSTLLEEDRVLKLDLKRKEADLLRLRGELETADIEEVERCQRYQDCCREIGSLRVVKETVLKFNIKYNDINKSCEICPMCIPDYSQRSDAFLSLFREDLETLPRIAVRVCVDEMDNLYVSSGENDTSVSVYNKDMQFVRQFKNNLLTFPFSMSIWEQTLFVTEWDNHSIFKFSLDGDLLASANMLTCPTGFAVSDNGLVYVTSTLGINVFTQELEHVTKFNAVENPCDLKFAKDNTLLVLEYKGVHMHWFSQEGFHGVFETGCKNDLLFFTNDKFDNILLSNIVRPKGCTQVGSINVYSPSMELRAVLDNKGCKQTLKNRDLTVRHDGVVVSVSETEPCLNFF